MEWNNKRRKKYIITAGRTKNLNGLRIKKLGLFLAIPISTLHHKKTRKLDLKKS